MSFFLKMLLWIGCFRNLSKSVAGEFASKSVVRVLVALSALGAMGGIGGPGDPRSLKGSGGIGVVMPDLACIVDLL